MHISSSLPLTALWLAFGSVVFAQCPASSPTPPPAVVPVAAASPSPVPSPVPSPASKLPVITQSSRVRAFNAGPGGEVRSLYLQNGSVVNLSPALGGQLGPVIRKGEKITVLGTKSQVNGQSFVEAASVRLNDQTFSSNTASVSRVLTEGPEGATPRPAAAPLAPPSFPPNKKKPVTPSPADGPADASPPQSDFGGPPPPPPDGMAPPPPPDGMAPPPPPLA